MTWCLLRGESRALPVNVLELSFDVTQGSCGRSHGQLTVQSSADDIRRELELIVHSREAVVLERRGESAIEMRLSCDLGAERTTSATYDWVAP